MFNDYLRELQRVALLAPAEEARLWRAYKTRADARSRARLIEAYQPLVFKVAMQLRLREAIVMDMIQEGTVGLIQAVERFDPNRGVRFSTFATYRIRGRILNALRRDGLAHARGRWPASLTDPAAGGALEPSVLERLADPAAADRLSAVEDSVVLRQIIEAIHHLPARERRILHGFFLAEEEPRRIAGELRISLSHFYRLQKHALRRIQELMLPAGLRAQGAPQE